MAGTAWDMRMLLPAEPTTRHGASADGAIGPGITELAIDWGVMFSDQAIVMVLWCAGLSAAMIPVARRIGGVN